MNMKKKLVTIFAVMSMVLWICCISYNSVYAQESIEAETESTMAEQQAESSSEASDTPDSVAIPESVVIPESQSVVITESESIVTPESESVTVPESQLVPESDPVSETMESQAGESEETVVLPPTEETTGETEEAAVYSAFESTGADGKIGAFVERLYVLVLDREPDVPGFEAWCNQLKNGNNTGADIIYGFLWSDEFIQRNFSDDEFVTVLYRSILGREPDGEGKADWLGLLNEGFSRLMVCSQFVASQEFNDLCAESGIKTGNIPLTNIVDQNQQIARFVNRLYELVLGRRSDRTGLEDWTRVLAQQNQTAAHVVEGFVKSPEFLEKNLSNEEYVRVLYRTLLDREADEVGLSEWVELLNQGYPKDHILKGFVESDEFTKLCAEYGIVRGTIDASERVYQNPSRYYQISNASVNLGSADYNLSYGYMGLKVAKVIQKLGVNGGRYQGMNTAARYTYTVQEKVQVFQRKNGLPVTGVVDLKTWLAMGLSENEWYTLGAYASPNEITPISTRSDCIETMISRAYDYMGTPYVVGASGAPGQGVDCSGLVMQALYAAGLDVSPIDPIRHSHPGYEYESANMWASSKFMHVSYSQRQRGDLIFYSNASGNVIHVAIYLGNNQVIESWCEPYNRVIVSPVITSFHGRVKGVARPFV